MVNYLKNGCFQQKGGILNMLYRNMILEFAIIFNLFEAMTISPDYPFLQRFE